MSSHRSNDRRWETLERLRTLELEEAQSERAALDDAVRSERAGRDELSRQIDSTRDLARAMVEQSQSFSAAALREINAYAAWQAGVLVEKEAALMKTERLAEDAQETVAQRFKSLSILEKLRERRQREQTVEALRRDQKTLDNQAILAIGEESGPYSKR